MKLTEGAVKEMIYSCLNGKKDIDESTIVVEGITARWGFNKTLISEHTHEIVDLLNQLPATFHSGTGGGWTFLNACNDRDGNQWTGNHVVMDALFCLGIAAGKATWLLHRELWDALPGGMPYVAVLA